MKKCLAALSVLVAITFVVGNAAAQEGGASKGQDHPAAPRANPASDDPRHEANLAGATELDRLKQRIDELERQNRAMMQLLVEIKGRLDESPRPASEIHRPADLTTPNGPQASRDAARAEVTKAAPATASAPASERAASQSSNQAKASPAPAPEPVRWSDLIGEGNRFKLYGFLRVDLDIDSQRPNNGQIPFFITSQDPRIGKPDAANFSMHPRLTRFGVDYNGPRISALGDAKLSGKLELDFENGGSESRQIVRIRHAYLKMNWKDFSILRGQTWDIFSPLYPTVNNDSLMWNAGNVGDRRPQFRFAYEPKAGHGQWSLIGGVGLTGAIDSLDLDLNGFRDGEESGRPDVQARVGYSHTLWVKDQSASIGASGFYGWLNTSRPVSAANRTSFRSQLINIDYTLPLAPRVSLRGEGWWGRNMSDVRGGAGQGLAASGRDIRGRGGWSELSVKVSRYYSFHPGYTTDDPVDSDLGAGGRTRNRAFYFGNRITPGGNFLIGLDYLRWKTDFKGFLPGVDNRVNIFFQYSY